MAYYRNIKKYLGNKYKEVLYALRDAACFSKIADNFIEETVFKVSLLREIEADRALQFAQYELAGFDAGEDKTFVFKAELPYRRGEYLNIKFNFGKVQREDNLNRIVALIGNNGIGKTTVLNQLAEALVRNKTKLFNPQLPVFSKVIAASYSIFDDFYNVKGSTYNYVYCGMQENKRIMNDDELAKRRRNSVELLKKKPGGHKILRRFLDRVIDDEIVAMMYNEENQFSEGKLQNIYKWLSSGQTMLMNLVIEILAHIRQNTLILIDEPEVHLHPNAITEMVHIIDSLCESYSSCCIMATKVNRQSTPVYVYIVCDIVSQIREFAEQSNLTVSPDDEGYFGYVSSYNAYVEIMSFKKVIDDATMRNKIFFHKLGLE